MKKYALVSDPKQIFFGDTTIGKWADGSALTIEEAVIAKHPLGEDYVLVSDLKAIRVVEIFDLATRFMVAYASAGIRPNAKDCFEDAALAYTIKDNL